MNSSFKGKKVLVIGEICLDEYLVGTPTKTTTEVPGQEASVLTSMRREVYAGMAANVYANVLSLGGESSLFSITGADSDGSALMELIPDQGETSSSNRPLSGP